MMNNSTWNVDNSVPDQSVVLYVIGTVFSVTITVGIIGNILIVSTIMKTKYLRTPMNVSLVSLACSDIVVCVLVLPLRLSLYSNIYSHSTLVYLCKVDIFMKSVCDYLQPSMLVATSFERYKSIAKPFESKGNMKRIVIVIVASLGSCGLLGVISTVLFEDGATLYPCNVEYQNAHLDVWNFREGFVTFPIGISCLILVACFYFLMLKTLKTHGNKMSKRTKPFKNKVFPTAGGKTGNKELLPTTSASPNDQSQRTPPSTASSLIPGMDVPSTNTNTANTRKISPSETTSYISETRTRKSSTESRWTSLATADVAGSGIHAYTRNISVRKSRDVIYIPQNANIRFPSLVKHVVTFKRHKRNSLERWKTRQINSTEGFSSPDFECETVCDKNKLHKNVSTRNLPGQSENGIVRTNPTDKNGVKLSECKPDKILKLEINTVAGNETRTEDHIGANAANTFPVISVPVVEETEVTNSSNTIEQCLSSGDSKKHGTPESTCSTATNMAQEGNKSAYSDVRDNVYVANEATDVKQSTDDEKPILNAGELNSRSGEITESCGQNTGKSTINANITETYVKDTTMICTGQSGHTATNNQVDLDTPLNNDDNVNISLKPNNDKDTTIEDNAKTKTMIGLRSDHKSQVDIVDFDGTVHKDIHVEGAVVGAVCVMNKSNKLAGRRKVEIRAAKRIAAMIGSFMLLWLPLPLIVLIVSSRQQITSNDIEALLISASISATTVAVNPILNVVLNKQLRSATISMMKRFVNSVKRTILQ